MKDPARRIVWFLLLPLFLLNGVLWAVGKLIESIGDALQQGADAIKDQLIRWGRVLFCVTDDKGRR